MKKQYRVAGVQASIAKFLDLDATVDKGVRIIEEAAKNGAELIVFPEAYFPGYPYWIWIDGPGYDGFQFWKRLRDNSLEEGGPALAKLAKAARDNNIIVCASGTEKDGGSLYLTQFWFDKQGNLMGKHRKIKPTGVERTIWAEGDGSMMQVFDTELGKLGGLQCWEHMMVANHVVMDALGEQVHAASWPAHSWDPTSPHYTDTPNYISRVYAMTTGTWVIMAGEVLAQEEIDEICMGIPGKEEIYKAGYAPGAKIINPNGKKVSEQDFAHDEEGIAYADIDLDEIDYLKYHIDTAGHYSRPSVNRIIFDRRPQPMVTIIGDETDYSKTYEELQSGDVD